MTTLSFIFRSHIHKFCNKKEAEREKTIHISFYKTEIQNISSCYVTYVFSVNTAQFLSVKWPLTLVSIKYVRIFKIISTYNMVQK
jgi:hypothetical protein